MRRIRTKGTGPRGEICNEFGGVIRTRKSVVQMARILRRVSTPAEQLLWRYLRGRALCGLKFYRQMPIDRFIADFYCPTKKLIVELDGGIHAFARQTSRDALRDTEIRKKGIRILRLTNDEVLRKTGCVLGKIAGACGHCYTSPHAPSPHCV